VKASRWHVSVKKPRAKDGANWLIRIRPPSGSGAKEQVRSSGTTDRGKAEEQARDIQARLNAELDGFDAAHTTKILTFEDMFRAHVAYREVDRETSPVTLAKYRSLARTLADNPIWKTLVSDVDRVAIVRARDRLGARGVDNQTVNIHISMMRKAWSWALERGLVSHDFPGLKRLRTEPTKKRPFTDTEVTMVLEQLKTYRGGQWYPIFCLQADTGSRLGAILKLRGRDVDYQSCLVTYSLKRKVYSVPVPPDTMALLPRVKGDQLLFPGKLSGKVVDTTYAAAVFREVLALTGIEDRELLGSHSFRRRAVATNLRSNVPMPLSMKFLGHSTAKIHLDYQRNAVGDDLRAVSRTLFERRHPSQDPSTAGRGTAAQVPGASASPGGGSLSACSRSRVGPDCPRRTACSAWSEPPGGSPAPREASRPERAQTASPAPDRSARP